MNFPNTEKIKFSKNIIIIDGDYIDHVAFNLTVNFERMLNRKIPKADFSQWIVNIALDGRMKQGNNQTQVVILHDKKTNIIENFRPSDLSKELNEHAFKDNYLGEFIISTIPIDNELTNKENIIIDLLHTIINHKEVERIMIIPNSEQGSIYSSLRKELNYADEEKHVTIFAMQPMEGGNFKQEILGYSIMHAMGITSDEINNKITT